MSNLSVATLLKIYKDASLDINNPHLYSSTIIDMMVIFLAKASRWQEEALTDEQQSLLLCEVFTQVHADMSASEKAELSGFSQIFDENDISYRAFLKAIQNELFSSIATTAVEKNRIKRILLSIAPVLTNENARTWWAHVVNCPPVERLALCNAFNYLQDPSDETTLDNNYLAKEPNPLTEEFAKRVFELLERGEFTTKLTDFFKLVTNSKLDAEFLITIINLAPENWAPIRLICSDNLNKNIKLTKTYLIDMNAMLLSNPALRDRFLSESIPPAKIRVFVELNKFGLWHGEHNQPNRRVFKDLDDSLFQEKGFRGVASALTDQQLEEVLIHYFSQPALVDTLRARLEAFLKDISESGSYNLPDNSQYSAARMIQQAINSQYDLRENGLLLKAVFEGQDSMRAPSATANNPYDAFLNDVQDAFLPAEQLEHHKPQFKRECRTIVSHLARYSDGSSLVDILKRLPDIDPGVRTMLCGAFDYLQAKGRKEDEVVSPEEYEEIAAAVSRYIVENEFEGDFLDLLNLIITRKAGQMVLFKVLFDGPHYYRGIIVSYKKNAVPLRNEKNQDLLLTHLFMKNTTLEKFVDERHRFRYADFIEESKDAEDYAYENRIFKQALDDVAYYVVPAAPTGPVAMNLGGELAGEAALVNTLRARLEAFLKDIGESPSHNLLENSQYSVASMIQQEINSQSDLRENDLLLKAVFGTRDIMRAQGLSSNDPYDAFLNDVQDAFLPAEKQAHHNLNDVQDAFLPAEKQAHHNSKFKHECKTILSHLARYAGGSSLVDVLKRLSDIDPGVCTMLCGIFDYLQEKGRKEDEGVGHEEYEEITAAVSLYLVAGEFKSDFFLIIAGEVGLEDMCEVLKGNPETYQDVRRNYNLLVGDVHHEFHKELLSHLLLASSNDVEIFDPRGYQNFITCLTTDPQYENARTQFKQLDIEINSLLPPKRAAAMANYPTGKAKEAAVEGDCQPQLFPRGGMFSAAPAQNTTSMIRSRP